MLLIDSHCHLNEDRFKKEGLTPEILIQNAQATDIKIMQTICTKMSEFEEIHAIAMGHSGVYCSVGVHPHHAGEEGTTLQDLLTHGTKEKVIAIGETGLDYYYNNAPRELQQESFRMHIEAARKLDVPVIIHNRNSDEDCMRILEEELKKQPVKLVFHCFSSSRELAQFAVKHGAYVSCSGIITFKKANDLRDILKNIPLEFMLVETDAPYLAPEPHRGRINEPAYTCHVAKKLAEIKETSLENIAKVTTENFFNLFTKTVRA